MTRWFPPTILGPGKSSLPTSPACGYRRLTTRTWKPGRSVGNSSSATAPCCAPTSRKTRAWPERFARPSTGSAGTVTLVDRWLGKLSEALRRMGRMDDTLIVFTSDQGEPLGEHGYVRRFRPWLYEELIHTPLIIRMPGARFGGIRHQALVQTVD